MHVVIKRRTVTNAFVGRTCTPGAYVQPYGVPDPGASVYLAAPHSARSPASLVLVYITGDQERLDRVRPLARRLAQGGGTRACPGDNPAPLNVPKPCARFSVTSWLLKKSKLLRNHAPLHVLEHVFEGAVYLHRKYNPAVLNEQSSWHTPYAYTYGTDAARAFVEMYFPPEIEIVLPDDYSVKTIYAEVRL